VWLFAIGYYIYITFLGYSCKYTTNILQLFTPLLQLFTFTISQRTGEPYFLVV